MSETSPHYAGEKQEDRVDLRKTMTYTHCEIRDALLFGAFVGFLAGLLACLIAQLLNATFAGPFIGQ